MKIYKKLYVGIMIILICIPMCFTALKYISGKSFDVSLIDNSGTTYEYPRVTVETYFSGEFQEAFESAWNNTFQFRGFITRTYNQFRYSVFNLFKSPTETGYDRQDIIIGKDDTLLEYTYIAEYEGLEDYFDYYDFSSTENSLKLHQYCSKLDYISAELEKKDKHLIFWFTSNKCDYTPDIIPDKFRNENNVRVQELIFDMLDNTNVHYINSKALLSEFDEGPIFYKTGIHWARPAEQFVCVKMLDEIEKAVGHLMPKVRLTNMNQQSTPYWRDNDLWDLLNLWEKANGTYYQYTEEVYQAEQPKVSGVLIQGGSFTEGLRQMLLSNGLVSDVTYINYDKVIYNGQGSIDVVIDKDWKKVDLEKYINSNEVIIIEMTDNWMSRWSSGFVDYLYEYLLQENRG